MHAPNKSYPLILPALLLAANLFGAEKFTEFYITPTGTNLNAGSTTNDAPIFTAASGNLTNATGVWTKSGSDLSAVGINMWASVYPDATTGNAVWVGRITAVDDTGDTITISKTVGAGSFPASVTNGSTVRVGGAWAGPNLGQANSASGFPFTFVIAGLTDTNGYAPCVNIKAGTYTSSNAVTITAAGPIVWAGYNNTPRDGGKATLAATTTVSGYTFFTLNQSSHWWQDIVFMGTNGTSGGNEMVNNLGRNIMFRCTFARGRGPGLISGISGNGQWVIACETYGCGANGANAGFYSIQPGNGWIDCVAHDTIGYGFYSQSAAIYVNCVSYNNTQYGFYHNAANSVLFLNCDAWFNGDGINLATASGMATYVNCNFLRNTNFGINTVNTRFHFLQNCRFGTGVQTNALGDYHGAVISSSSGVSVTNNLGFYATGVTPWMDPTNGNFSISPGAKVTGFGTFTLYGTNSPTIARPDIGAAQSLGGSGGAYTFGP